jgi:sugar phosphate isomerase/epimerase
MKLAALTNPQHNLLDEITWIAANGFACIDLVLEAPGATLESTDWSTVQVAIVASGLPVICRAASYLPIHNPSPRVRQAAADELRRSIDAAQLVGSTLLTTSFLGWPAHMSEAVGYEYYRQLYELLLKHGSERGVRVALENSPNNTHQLKWFREIYQRLPGLKHVYNLGHGNVQTRQSLTREHLFALNDRLVHVRLSANDGVSNGHLPLGAPANGGIDWARDLRILRSFRYEGTITLEIGGERRWLLASAQWLRERWEQAE